MEDIDIDQGPQFAVIALGSNIGDKCANIATAADLLARVNGISVAKRSQNYRTPPWGNTDQDWFVNACMSVNTTLSPHALLAECLETERKMGRMRGQKWGPRVIDLDVLVYADLDIRESDLVVPHPYITERAFVLAPMADVAPEFVLKGKTVAAWLGGADLEGIEPIA